MVCFVCVWNVKRFDVVTALDGPYLIVDDAVVWYDDVGSFIRELV